MADAGQLLNHLKQTFKDGSYESYLENVRRNYQVILGMDESLQDAIFEMRDTAAMCLEN